MINSLKVASCFETSAMPADLVNSKSNRNSDVSKLKPSEVTLETPIPGTQKLSNLYTPNFIRAWQIIYGSEGIVSQGGIESVDAMFSNINLNGKKVLDVGCGLGGADIHLAKKYDVEILGVDKEPYMTGEAEKLLLQHSNSLKGRVSFHALKAPTSLAEFPDDTFDLLYSKEMLYHVPIIDKQCYVNEMFRVLKPGGKIVIADWHSSTSVPGQHVKRAIRTEGFCHYITPQDFQTMLKKARFTNITLTNVSKEHIDYTKRDIKRLNSSADKICQVADKKTLDHVTISWNLFLEALESRELLASIFVATKPAPYGRINRFVRAALRKIGQTWGQ